MITAEHQLIAQSLVDELTKERDLKKTEGQQLDGAIQGVNLLFTKLVELEQQKAAEVADEQSDKSVAEAKTKKAK